ncbi:hypothetical protein QQX98_006722 [Neonectria punicea]|uniref:Uncharacterized protein n=1 Tax=Neonectria punicea TaxID=979145 RepID=A0ABR1H045_9HYPO
MLHFFKYAIMDRNLDMVRLLLEYNVSVHNRLHEAESPIEYACSSPIARYICDAEVGRTMFQELLDHCDRDKLNEFSTREKPLGLLHNLATSKNATGMLWLVKALVQHGVNVNAISPGAKGLSVLAYHLHKLSFQSADLLLELGADPTAGGCRPGSPTALQVAIQTRNVDFLKRLLNHTLENCSIMNWGKPMDIVAAHSRTTITLKGANALHVASLNYDPACLNFFLDNKLIHVETSKSLEGWTPLHVSSARGSVETTKLLLSHGFDLMVQTNHQQTPVHLAVLAESLPVLKFLLENGASMSFDADGKAPRQLALERNMAEIIQYLGNLSKDEEIRPKSFEATGLSRRQIAFMANALGNAVQNNDEAECKRLYTEGYPIDIALPETKAGSALILALEMGGWKLQKGFCQTERAH